MAWNPWRDLRGREHLILGMHELPDALGGGLYLPDRVHPTILLDRRLDAIERRCALAHELVHDERGGGCDHPGMPRTWGAVVGREERRVQDEAVRRLVPPEQLLEFCVRVAEVEGSLGPAEVAEEFDVTHEVAERALEMLSGA
jgi:hypothetical protein